MIGSIYIKYLISHITNNKTKFYCAKNEAAVILGYIIYLVFMLSQWSATQAYQIPCFATMANCKIVSEANNTQIRN